MSRRPQSARRTTSRDIAARASVSQATVSRVLSGSTNVSPETRQRVLAVLEETGYRPDGVARAMITRRTGSVGVVVDDITNPFYPQLLQALSAELSAADRRMLFWNSSGAGEPGAVEAIRQRLVDGVIFTTATAGSEVLLEAIADGAPAVLVNRYVRALESDTVVTDNTGGGRLVAEYLVGHGHRRVAVIAGPRGVSTATDRTGGFVRALNRLDAPLDRSLRLQCAFTHAAGHEAARRLLALDEPPSAIFCVNDVLAFGAIDAARAAGVRVPDDVWIIGFDDIDMASWEAFDLTTVRQPMLAMARAAVEILLARLEDPDAPPISKRFGSELIVRRSTAHAPLPPSDA